MFHSSRSVDDVRYGTDTSDVPTSFASSRIAQSRSMRNVFNVSKQAPRTRWASSNASFTTSNFDSSQSGSNFGTSRHGGRLNSFKTSRPPPVCTPKPRYNENVSYGFNPEINPNVPNFYNSKTVRVMNHKNPVMYQHVYSQQHCNEQYMPREMFRGSKIADQHKQYLSSDVDNECFVGDSTFKCSDFGFYRKKNMQSKRIAHMRQCIATAMDAFKQFKM